jgi:hypothetical protein
MKFYSLPTFVLVPILASFLWSITSCEKDKSFYEGKANVDTSVDTLMFDTVFTSVGSATRFFKIYNKESRPIQVSVKLSKPTNSPFRINVDGFKGPIVDNVEILPNDSIYVFAEVTINPNNPLSVSPFVIEENIIITQNGNDSKVLLTAWGQNANYISKAGQIGLLSCNNGMLNFSDPKPYVVYGILVIDDCQVTLPKGTRVYVHGGIAFTEDRNYYNDGQIIVLDGGRIISQGTLDAPVLITGDRLEADYADDPGQWGGVRFYSGSKGNSFQHTTIKNSIVGLVVDSAATLGLSHCTILNTSSSGLVGINGSIKADNTLIHSSGSHNVQIIQGGDHTFRYCTFASFGNQKEAIFATNKRCLDLQNDITCVARVVVSPLNLSMTNCIISGGSTDEIAFDNFTKDKPENFRFSLKNCVVRVDELIKTDRFPKFFDDCVDCYNQKSADKLFLKQSDKDFTLDTMSVALQKALPLADIRTDRRGKSRKSKPDVGCFEF